MTDIFTLFKTQAIILKMVTPRWARIRFERTTEVNLLLQLFIPLCFQYLDADLSFLGFHSHVKGTGEDSLIAREGG